LFDYDRRRVTTLNPDGSDWRPVELKEGRLVRWVSPAQNLVWFEGKDGQIPDPIPEDQSGLTLHVRPLDDETARPTDLGLRWPPSDVVWILPDGRTVFSRWFERGPDGATVWKRALIDAKTTKRTLLELPKSDSEYFVADLAPDRSWVLASESLNFKPE